MATPPTRDPAIDSTTRGTISPAGTTGGTPAPGGPYGARSLGAGGAQKRPTGVTVLAVLAAVGAVLALLGAMGALAGAAFLGAAGEGAFGGIAAALGVFLLIYAAVAAAVAYGLLNQMRWAWYTALVLVGLGVLSALMSFVGGDIMSGIFGLALNGFILWYLLKPEVQAWFGVNYNTPWKYPGRPA